MEMNWTILIGIVVIIIVGAIALVVIGLRNPGGADDSVLQARLEEFSQKNVQVNLEKLELSQPFTERIIFPMARKLGDLAIRFTPQNALVSISRQLELAGSPPKLDPTMFLSMQFIAAVSFAGLIGLVFAIKEGPPPAGEILMYALGAGIVGFYFPKLWLSSKISRRQKEIRKAMPDALDLLTICVEAGLGFDAAMSKVSEKWKNELAMAFARIIQEVQLGKLRSEAMRDMADNIGIAEMTSFVAAIIQSEQLGVSMSKVLHIQSEQMRMKRRQLAEEEAHKAPLKMLIPMTLLIFPTLFIVLMTPAALRMMNSGLGKMFGM